MLLRAIHGRRTGGVLKTTCSLLLLLFYIAGNTQFEAHRLSHAHESFALHSAALEKDPCHRVTYHHDNNNRCRHASHISSKNKCALCDILGHLDQVFTSHNIDTSFRLFDKFQVLPIYHEVNNTWTYLPSRAPPLS